MDFKDETTGKIPLTVKFNDSIDIVLPERVFHTDIHLVFRAIGIECQVFPYICIFGYYFYHQINIVHYLIYQRTILS